jgi:Kef-type K+ transport system membrane component KefB
VSVNPMLLNSRTGKNARHFVERKLLIRLKLFFVVFSLLMVVILHETIRHYITMSTALGAMMLGMLVSGIFVRRKRIYWEEETSRVIARMDRIGLVLLALYIAFAIIRHFLLDQWLHGRLLVGFSFSLAAGSMLGRLLSMRSQIRQILKEKNII